MKITNTLLIRPNLRGWALAMAVVGGLLTITETARAQTQVYSEDFEANSQASHRGVKKALAPA